eukprot:scaffold324_cov326-Pavlova_lutheri.AAC.3
MIWITSRSKGTIRPTGRSRTNQCHPPRPTAFLTYPSSPTSELLVRLFPVTSTLVRLGSRGADSSLGPSSPPSDPVPDGCFSRVSPSVTSTSSGSVSSFCTCSSVTASIPSVSGLLSWLMSSLLRNGSVRSTFCVFFFSTIARRSSLLRSPCPFFRSFPRNSRLASIRTDPTASQRRSDRVRSTSILRYVPSPRPLFCVSSRPPFLRPRCVPVVLGPPSRLHAPPDPFGGRERRREARTCASLVLRNVANWKHEVPKDVSWDPLDAGRVRRAARNGRMGGKGPGKEGENRGGKARSVEEQRLRGVRFETGRDGAEREADPREGKQGPKRRRTGWEGRATPPDPRGPCGPIRTSYANETRGS